MSMHKKFCDGELSKIEKLGLLGEFFTQGNATSSAMISDRKLVLASEFPKLTLYCSFYMILGTGYAMFLNLFVNSPKAFYVLPTLTCVGFGYFKYFELVTEKARLVDKYEVDMIKKYCKKVRKD